MEQVEIALAANGPYFCGMLVTACSIARSAGKKVEGGRLKVVQRNEFRLSYNILDGGLSEEQKAFMERRVRDYYPDSAFRYLPVNDELFNGYPAWHGNKMAYARLILPSALPDKDWCIYCDVDFTWLRDIGELWEMRDDSVVFLGTADGNSDTLAREEAWFKKKGFPFDRETYFCSGLCFFNLKAFREQKLIEQCAEILAANPDIQYPDQAALNIVTFGKRKIVPRTWQRFTYELTDEIVEAGCVVHHAGEIPWNRVRGRLEILSDAILLWHRVNAEIHGVTVWQSLRRYNSAFGILYHRALWWLFRCPLVMLPLKFACSITHHSGVYGFIACRARKLRMK